MDNVGFEDLPVLYQGADLFIYPSVFEGFGIPIIEALFSHTPVITSKGSCFSEAGGQYSSYINPNDFEELGNEIYKILNDNSKRNYMAEKGFEFVQKFNDKNFADNTINEYSKLLHQ